jgi:hypothetical protein
MRIRRIVYEACFGFYRSIILYVNVSVLQVSQEGMDSATLTKPMQS